METNKLSITADMEPEKAFGYVMGGH